jgi:hypothetical protein
VLGRNERELFRAIDMNASLESKEEAHTELIEKMEKALPNGAEVFPQGD